VLENVKLEKAQELILNRVTCLPDETVPLLNALGCYIYKDIYAPVDLPSCRKSALDGYAVSVNKEAKSHSFRIVELKPGPIPPGFMLEPGQAARVATGDMVPEGTVVVIPQEATRQEGDLLRYTGNIKQGNNIRPQGEDFKANDLLLQRGTAINAGAVGVLAAFGMKKVPVFRRPRVAILGLGQGVVSHKTKPAPGQIRDSNGPLLAALAMNHGAQVVDVELAVDGDLSQVKNILEELLRRADIVLTTGGTARGEHDQALWAVRQTGARVLFWELQIKPGSHSGAAVCEDKLIISLSGNPAACSAGYHLLAAPVLRLMQGQNFYARRVKAVCADDFPRKGGPRRFLQGHLETGPGGLRVSILSGQKSSMMRGLLKNGNVLIDLPAGQPPLEQGDEVTVIILESNKTQAQIT